MQTQGNNTSEPGIVGDLVTLAGINKKIMLETVQQKQEAKRDFIKSNY